MKSMRNSKRIFEPLALIVVLVLGIADSAGAYAVPPPWISVDIGNPSPGSSDYNPPTHSITITANGKDIWDDADNFHYVYQEISGDCEIIARLASFPLGVDSWQKAGVMIRDTTAGGSSFVDMVITGYNEGAFQWRNTLSGGCSSITTFNIGGPPKWVRLARSSNVFSAYWSNDGSTWTQVGSAHTTIMSDPVLIGMCVTSHSTGNLVAATFDNLGGDFIPLHAHDPNPADGAAHHNTVVVLSWTPGAGISDVNGHHVYFGTDFDDVNNGSGDADKGFTTNAFHTEWDLIPETTYYWRVDEVNHTDNLMWRGDVWSFILPSRGDLVVRAVDTQGTPIAGRPLCVLYDVVNDDPDDTILGGFFDAVYLSSDKEWDIGDIFMAKVQHNQLVEPQAGYHAETDVILPGVLPGPYYVLVGTDFGNLVYEPDGEYNNIASTDDNVVVDLEELTIGTPADSNFVHPELSRYFRVTAPAGEDVEIRLDDLDDAGSNELYVSFERIPTRSKFDYRYGSNFAPDQTIRIPDTHAGTYYELAYGSNLGGSSQAAFTIGVHFMPLEITEISPARGGNAGTVTATIQGARFKSSTITRLIGSDGTVIIGELHKLSSTMEMIVAFDLRGAAVDTYDVEVKNAEDEVFVMENALEVVEASLPEIQVSLITPSVVRAGSNGTFYVEVYNPGLNDAIWPTIWIGLPDGMKAWLDRDLPVKQSEEIRIDSPSSLAVPSVLPPGTSVRLPVCFRAGEPNGNASISLEVFYSESVLTEPMSVVGNTSAPAGLSGDFFGSYKTPDGKVSCSVSGTYEMVAWPSGWFQQLLQDEFGSLQGWDYNEVALPFWGLTGPSLTPIANASKLGASIRILEPYAWIQTVKVSAEPSTEPNNFQKQLHIDRRLPANQLPLEFVDPIYGHDAHDTLPFYYTGSGFGSFSDDPGFPTQELVNLLDIFGMRGADGKRRARIQFEFETHPSEWDGKKDSYPEVVDLGSLGLAWDLKIMMSQEPDKQEIKPLRVVRSRDPNKKIGPAGSGSSGLVLPGQLMVYTVYFENEPNASAAALEVRIEDRLDQDLDWTTFELLEIGFGEYQIAVPSGTSHYDTRMALDGWTFSEADGWHTGQTPLIVEANAELDIETGQVVWNLKSFDPNTGWEPEDAYAGFLPPDDPNDETHRGEGYVSFAIRPKVNSPAGTLITNSAKIFFDQNPRIETPSTSNIVTIDLADLDLSGEIDFGDIARLADEWLWVGLPGTVDEDIVVDGSVNFLDYVKVAEKWLSP